MPEYTIVVHVEPKALGVLESNNYFLCMSQAVNGTSGEPDSNVVALAAEVAPTNTIKFTNKYSINGSKQTFKLSKTTSQGDGNIHPIEFGQAYRLKSWSDTKVITTDQAPPGGFAFMNDIQAAAAISLEQEPTGTGAKEKPNAPSLLSTVQSSIEAEPDVVYISSQFVPGIARLTPIPQIVLWFQQNVAEPTRPPHTPTGSSHQQKGTGRVIRLRCKAI
ncbi:hypothetical protein CPB83DRAFT_888585 [Crepidotus variabilis]|uniref:Uncharacterized protein n=1 Tax=Crepidotus variabilis TaxID=179855 RepID=A0A9P6EST9_9AGAR|nr:hypothetical protein CPB83DRAFT_888585 [Crepidotus variabilis]